MCEGRDKGREEVGQRGACGEADEEEGPWIGLERNRERRACLLKRYTHTTDGHSANIVERWRPPWQARSQGSEGGKEGKREEGKSSQGGQDKTRSQDRHTESAQAPKHSACTTRGGAFF